MKSFQLIGKFDLILNKSLTTELKKIFIQNELIEISASDLRTQFCNAVIKRNGFAVTMVLHRISLTNKY